MAPSDDRALAARARWMYEFGRIRQASKILVCLVPMVGLSLVQASSSTARTLTVGGVLAALTIGLLWRGEAFGRAVGPGLGAGLLPLVAPLVLQQTGYCCAMGSCSALCLPVCASAGLVAGIAVGLRASGESKGRPEFVGSAFVVAALTGTMGCVGMGFGIAFGMVAALALGSLPVAALGVQWRRG